MRSSSAFSILSCTSRSTLSVEKRSTRYATWSTTRWNAAGLGTHCRHKPLPCAKAPTRQLVTARSASLLAVPTSSWISRQMRFSGFFRMVCRTDRASTYAYLYFFCSNHDVVLIFVVGPARGSASFGILSHVPRSAPSRIVLVAHLPDARHPPLALPRPPPEIPHHPHTPHHAPPATIRPASACPTLLPPRPDHTVCRFRSDADGREALPRDADFHIPANAERRSHR